VQLRLPGRVLPTGSGGAFDGGRSTRDSGSAVWLRWVGAIGPLQATSASKTTERMREPSKSRASQVPDARAKALAVA
jgi:hypothetical protein